MAPTEPMAPPQLRRIRELTGWTQAQAAGRAGVTQNTWARWERGEMAVHPARVALLQHTLQQAERQAEKRAARKAARAAARAVTAAG